MPTHSLTRQFLQGRLVTSDLLDSHHFQSRTTYLNASCRIISIQVRSHRRRLVISRPSFSFPLKDDTLFQVTFLPFSSKTTCRFTSNHTMDQRMTSYLTSHLRTDKDDKTSLVKSHLIKDDKPSRIDLHQERQAKSNRKASGRIKDDSSSPVRSLLLQSHQDDTPLLVSSDQIKDDTPALFISEQRRQTSTLPTISCLVRSKTTVQANSILF